MENVSSIEVCNRSVVYDKILQNKFERGLEFVTFKPLRTKIIGAIAFRAIFEITIRAHSTDGQITRADFHRAGNKDGDVLC